MHRVSILNTESIFVGSGLTSLIAKETIKKVPCSAYVFVSDENVAPLHLLNLKSAFLNELENNPVKILEFIIPPGELHKTRDTKASVEDFMLANACTRDTCLIALGGGVIGDLVGFVAANFMRGIPVIQVPTTLLAMVDSSIGGKTAIDTPNGKNLIGAFHQPTRIFIDIDYLKTLPKREFVNGLAEVIKTAAIWMEKDFDLLENYPEKVLSLVGGSSGTLTYLILDVQSEELLVKIILGSVQVKAHVVTVDEKETGLRGLLNFGHTIGHAIEAIVFPDLLHGECVSIGMAIEAEISRHLGHLSNVSVGRLVRCLQSYGLPVSLNDKIFKMRTNRHCSVEEMMNIMRVDKKNKGDKKRMVMLSRIGGTLEERASYVDDKVIQRVLSPAVQIIPAIPSDKPIKVTVPGSKSISNRALVLAALGKGPCRLRGLLHSDDVQVMLDALQKLVGITFNWEDEGNTLLIVGGEGKLRIPETEIYLGNAGTASRFLTTVCSLIKGTGNGREQVTLTGNARMKQRPIGPLVDALKTNGSSIRYLENTGCFPLEILATNKGLTGGVINLSASVSSQYVSSILISAPYANEPVVLDLSGDSVISQPYIDMTIKMMKSFGVSVNRIGNSNKYHIPLGVYQNPPEYLIEADASSATYPLAFAAITGNTVTVTNIGSSSMQGDADFAVKVLRPMGCEVTQTATTTTVKGPTKLAPIELIDMETMTDAFMTATVLAAVAQDSSTEKNTTQIVGIANQRVKECDRIAAMIEQLARLGVDSSELPDGLQIHGVDKAKLLNISPDGIKCYDDHRIAMSFSVLAAAYPPNTPGLIILEKKCVEKTWPSWWDTVQNTLMLNTIGFDESHNSLEKPSNVPQIASVVLIGMRGAGKTTMGRFGAKYLNWHFVDLDHYLEESINQTIPEYLETHDWKDFRLLESKLLKEVLQKFPTKTVVSCGGGIVEGADSKVLLKDWPGLVIHIARDINTIENYLWVDKTRPSLTDDIRAVWARRQPLYEELSQVEFFIHPKIVDDNTLDYGPVEQSFGHFLDFHLTAIRNAKSSNAQTFFVSLTCSNVENIKDTIDYLVEGVDAVELRADLLESHDIEFVRTQVHILRQLTAIPIVFTVRSESQGGKFPDDQPEAMIKLLESAIRWGCEYIDVEFTQPYNRFDTIVKKKGNSLIIGSYHDVSGKETWGKNGSMVNIYKQLHSLSDIIKLIGKASSIEDNFVLYQYVNEVIPNLKMASKPLITLLMGKYGRLSRCLNTTLTPVTHSKITVPAAPGQVTVAEIHQIRNSLGLLESRKYCLFGTPIQASMSPMLHNTGFNALGLPYKYSLNETNSWQTVRETLKEFAGSSVTIPLKQDVLQLCNEVDHAAKVIGAVNTLINDDGFIRGFNTDWVGIQKCIKKYITQDEIYIGIVIGAGGTSRAALYALSQMKEVGEVRLWNRTASKAKGLSNEFNCKHILQFEDLFKSNQSGKKVNFIVIGTIPADTQSTLPLNVVISEAATICNLGIALDMAYRPRETPLLSAIRKSSGWKCVEGIEVLLEQGYEQFHLWTGYQAPKAIIKDQVMQFY
ncbi:EPSP synthase-domain-containing protein [Globomyces pollinis-pini]|nr:EPSP synthase-domain-containing protein [Globomyces pollinis-pini]